MQSRISFKFFVHEGGQAPQLGKRGDAGIDVFARITEQLEVNQFQSVKIPLGFSYAILKDGELTDDFFLDVRNRSGVGTQSGMATLAETGDANYRGELHYCAAKITPGVFIIKPGMKIAQIVFSPFIDPFRVEFYQTFNQQDLGITARGSLGFGSSGG
jgi:deoxyuridine 5'-triphosphate nucleotidohydrolase